MSEAIKWILGSTLDMVYVGSLYVGLAQGHENLLNVGLFLAYFSIMVNVVLALCREFPKVPAPRMTASFAADIVALGMLIWHGYMATAALLCLSILLMAGRVSSEFKNAKEKEA